MIQAYLDYQYSNLIGIILFIIIGWLASKSDVAKDILALLFIALLTIPVSFVIYAHYAKQNWPEFVICILIQAVLFYGCYLFVRYMYYYHKKNKYIFWQ